MPLDARSWRSTIAEPTSQCGTMQTSNPSRPLARSSHVSACVPRQKIYRSIPIDSAGCENVVAVAVIMAGTIGNKDASRPEPDRGQNWGKPS